MSFFRLKFNNKKNQFLVCHASIFCTCTWCDHPEIFHFCRTSTSSSLDPIMSSPSAENPIDNESLERALTMEEWMRESSKEKRAIREFERRVITDECSFAKGYVLQPVFACATCTPPDSGVYVLRFVFFSN